MWRSRRVVRKRSVARSIGATFLAGLVVVASIIQTYQPAEAGTSSWASNIEATGISAGDGHSCAVADGAASCWGLNTNGQLGRNNTSSSSAPVPVYTSGVLGGKTVTAISTGTSHSCAVADGAAYCWGLGTGGRLGHNSTGQSTIPVAVNTSGVLNGRRVTAISAGDAHTCAVADGMAFCWGTGAGGRLGNNGVGNSSIPVAVNTSGVLAGRNVTAISAGNEHTCAIADGLAFCWGTGTSGRLGNNSTSQSNVPVEVNTAGVLSGKKVTSISAGVSHTCAVADGAAYCWGPHTSGRVGNNTDTGSSSVPVAVNTSGVLGGKTVTGISAGSAHSCAVASDVAICWGLGGNGRLGNNAETQYNVPVAVNTAGGLGGTTVTNIVAGISHTCAIASSQVYCWGLGDNGRLGNDSVLGSLAPVAVTSFSAALSTSSYRWYQNANSTTPGAPLSGADVTTRLSSPGDTFRLRQGIYNGVGFTSIATGGNFSCGLANGIAYCWGAGTNGRLGNNSTAQSLVPVAVDTSGVLAGKTITAIAAGDNHACVIASGAAYCWGAGTDGQLGNAASLDSPVPVAVSTATVLSGKAVTDISAGGSHTCVVASGAAYCWGAGASGRLGNNSASTSNIPVAVYTSGVLGGKTVTAISSGSAHTCAIADDPALLVDDAAYCWGLGTNGQLGNNGAASSNFPVAVHTAGVFGGKQVTDISAGGAHTCAVASGAAYCWGAGTNGRLGHGSVTSSNFPVAVNTTGVLNGKTVTAIAAAGTSHTCAIADGAAYCWGAGTNGRLGNNGTSQSTSPVAVYTSGVLSGLAVTAISSGTDHTCIVAPGQAYCWGLGDNGRLGSGVVNQSQIPVTVSMNGPLHGKTITSISSGASHTCAVADGAAYCWGLNTNGQLGNNTTISSEIPVAVTTAAGLLSGKTVTDISAGDAHTCAVASGVAYCWGLGTSGRLGNSSTAQQLNPVAVTTAAGRLSGKTVTDISAGTAHSCAVASGVAYCWGLGDNGRLGSNATTTTSSPFPVYVSGVLSGKTMTAISAGDSHTCAIGSGEAYCWGLGTSGRLGNNATAESTIPVAVNTGSGLSGKTVTAISAGISHTCAVASGVAYCWGPHTSGRVGNDTSSGSSSVPVAVNTAGALGGKVVTDISAGSAHSCAVAGNAAYCWGLGGNGRLGNNSNTQSNVPVAVNTTGVLNGKSVTVISAGTSHSCAVGSANSYCWGFGTDGRLGHNSTATDNLTPVSVYTKSASWFSGSSIVSGANYFVLQYAALSAATCALQTTGFATVTTSTPIAYHTNPGVANGSAIAKENADPTGSATTVPQTYHSANVSFTNTNDIPPGYTGLFDFSLKDNSAVANTDYCIRIAYGSGAALEKATAHPQVMMANGVLVIGIVNAGGSTVSSPTFPMSATIVKTTCQQVTGTFGTASQRIRVFNSLYATGWSINVAATNGPTSAWSSGSSSYDFNDPSGSPSGCNSGSDGDGIAGRMTLNPAVSTLTPQSGCATTGISKGGIVGFSQGVTDVATILAASSSTPTNCNYHITNVAMSQYIPASQPAGSYSISMTVTAVAQ